MSDLVVYNDGELELNISVNEDTIWLTQKQIAELFEVTVPNINMHIKAIYKEEELFENRTIQKYLIVQQEGKREIKRELEHYNLDAYLFVSDIIKGAKKSIFLIDNYIDESILILFTKRNANVKTTFQRNIV